jgi:hypothetical protein
MTQARQWWVLVRYKDEPGAGFGKQYVTATNWTCNGFVPVT